MTKKFPIPASALENHIAILGKTGSGKTSTGKLIVEHAVANDFRVCILDPIKSDWWGLASSGDGKKPGLPFQILGGPHGAMPLSSSAGAVVGRLVGEGRLPLSIIDMADFEMGGLQKFFIDFAHNLMRHASGVVYLVIEEAHEFAPKERAGIGAESHAIHWAKKMATAGRSKGIRLIFSTQRTQSLHNACLSSCETLIAHRLFSPDAQAPVLKWLKANVDAETLTSIASSLAKLKTGEAWVCSAEAEIVKRTQFPKFHTYDNSATPTAHSTAPDVAMAPADAALLEKLLGDAAKEAAENDPRALKKRIKHLERELKNKISAPDEAALIDATKRGHDAGAKAMAANFSGDMQPLVNRLEEDLQTIIQNYRNGITSMIQECIKDLPVQRELSKISQPNRLPKSSGPAKKSAPARAAPDADLTGPQVRILQALAWWRNFGFDQPTRTQTAILAGFGARGSHLRNTLSSLKSGGFIDYPSPGHISLTDDGLMNAAEPTDTTAAQAARDLMTGPQKHIFDALQSSADARFTRPELAEAAGFGIKSSHFRNTLSSLKSMGVISYPESGVVQLEEWVWS